MKNKFVTEGKIEMHLAERDLKLLKTIKQLILLIMGIAFRTNDIKSFLKK